MIELGSAPIAGIGSGAVEVQLPSKVFTFTKNTPSVTLAEEIHVNVTLPESEFTLSSSVDVEVVGLAGNEPDVDADDFYTDIDPVARFGGSA